MMPAFQAGGPDASGKPKACNRQALQAFGVKKERRDSTSEANIHQADAYKQIPYPFASPPPW